MDQCRLCLSKRRNLRTLFHKDSNGTSYVDMVISIANVKIIKEENVPENICLACRKKLREAYDFKIMIESSDLALHQDTNLKRINFSNINDIKIKIESLDGVDFDKNKNNKENHVKPWCFNLGEKTFFYNSTVITKLDPDENGNIDCSSRVKIDEFLRTFKDEPDYFKDEPDYDHDDEAMYDYQDCVDYSDDDYNISLKQRLKKKKKKKALKKKELETILIKPILLNDLRVIRTKSKIKESNKTKKKYVKTSMCNYCGKMSTNIKQHLLQHTGTRKYKCNACPKAFLTERNLKYHQELHTKEKNFKCDKCLARFQFQDRLKSHMLVHVEEKNHVCPICSKAFKRKTAMLRHVPIHSVASKSIKCELCNMSFISNYGLKHHMRVHTGERPYRCEMCSQGYSYKHDFNRHCLKKHGVFFKRRSVNIMNEEVLQKEKELMRKLMLRVNGIINDDEPLKAFDVPQGQTALAQAIKLIESKQISVDLNF